ncbi:MAG: protein-disulfide reductase DsbD family protein [Spirochaetes bacterium]|nr:protein-disulfide reductase DsbD family protein [Spirochaetota bacterium]
MRRIILILFLQLVINTVSNAQINAQLGVSVEPKKVEIPVGGVSNCIVKIVIPKGYHIYGNPVGPGTGKATTLSFRNLPDYIEVGAIQYPSAKKHYEPGDKGYVWVHEGEILLVVPLKAKSNAKVKNIEADLVLDALLCGKGVCIPIEKKFRQQIAILPHQSPFGGRAIGTSDNNLEKQSGNVRENKTDIHLQNNNTIIPYEFVPRYIEATMVGNIIQAILFGFLAGIILNVMPCVLPVVSLKVMNFISLGGGDKKKIVITSVLFSLGIIFVFLIVASLAAFFGYGWGELFKHKEFLVVMIAIVFVLALSLFDVFIITPSLSLSVSSGAMNNIYIDSFVKGIFATFLATPCSGPFLGGTLAWTMMQPPYIVFTVFSFIGIGMAFPYFILAVRPSLLRFLPKPGEWTVTFAKIMGFLLLGTAVYLIGVMEKKDVMPMLWFLLFIFAAFWQYGKYGSAINPLPVRVVSRVVLLLMVGVGYILTFHVKWDENERFIASQPYSFLKIVQNSTEGKISVVQFTAEWCPNCKVVERTSLYTRKVFKMMREINAELFIADITRKNAEAEMLMKRLGSHSIPFLAVFPPGDSFIRPICLRDMYSERSVLAALRDAVSSGHGVSSIEEKGIRSNE